MNRTEFRCVACGSSTGSRAFSTDEWYCKDDTGQGCEADGNYPADVLACSKCGYELTQVDPGSQSRQPNGGTVFHAPGNWGSTVWDPPVYAMGGPVRVVLEISICDACLREHFQQVLRVETRTERHEGTRMWIPPNTRIEEGN